MAVFAFDYVVVVDVEEAMAGGLLLVDPVENGQDTQGSVMARHREQAAGVLEVIHQAPIEKR